MHDYDGLWHNTPFYVSFIPFSESAGIKFTSFNFVGVERTGSKAFIDLDGNNELVFYSVDDNGVVEEPKKIFVALDSNAPLIDFNSLSGWQKQAFDFNFSVSDSLSGLKEASYRVDGNEWLAFFGQASMQMNTDGNHLIEFKAVDFAGNESNASTFLALDRIAPGISVNLAEGQDINSFDYSLNGSFFDEHSGVESLSVFVDGNEFNSVMLDGNWFSDINFSGNGLHEILVNAVDFAGNEKTLDFNVSVLVIEAEASNQENQDANLQDSNSSNSESDVVPEPINEVKQENQSSVQEIQSTSSFDSAGSSSSGSSGSGFSGSVSSKKAVKAEDNSSAEITKDSNESVEVEVVRPVDENVLRDLNSSGVEEIMAYALADEVDVNQGVEVMPVGFVSLNSFDFFEFAGLVLERTINGVEWVGDVTLFTGNKLTLLIVSGIGSAFTFVDGFIALT